MTFRSFLVISFCLAMVCNTACSRKSGDPKREISEGVHDLDFSGESETGTIIKDEKPKDEPGSDSKNGAQDNSGGSDQKSDMANSEMSPGKEEMKADDKSGSPPANASDDLLAPESDDFDDGSSGK